MEITESKQYKCIESKVSFKSTDHSAKKPVWRKKWSFVEGNVQKLEIERGKWKFTALIIVK